MELRKYEESEELKQDGQRIRNFKKEINMIFDKNLDECLVNFMEDNGLKINEGTAAYWLIKYNQYVKDSLK